LEALSAPPALMTADSLLTSATICVDGLGESLTLL